MRRFGLCALLIFVAIEAAGMQTTSLDWVVFHSDRFNIFFQQGDSVNARKILSILQAEYPSISTELRADVTAPIGVFLAPNARKFNQLTGGAIPHWGEAVADPHKQLIIIKSPRWKNPSGDLRVILVHELVHVLTGAAVEQRRVPRWLGEGLAIYYSGETSHFGGEKLSKAQLSKQLIPLRQIDLVLNFGQTKAELAYQQAYLAVLYLIEAYGQDAVPLLLSALREHESIDDAFRATLGLTLEQFEQEWQREMQKKYRWSFLIDFETYLWLFIVLLFLLAFAGMLMRRRRIIRQWEDESLDTPLPPEN